MRTICRLAAAAMATLVGMGVVDACPAAAQPELRASFSLGGTAFYAVPEGKLEGHPGDVIKSREVVSPLFPTASVRQIMYQSTDIHGNPIPVTGALLVPRGPSQGPRPLIALMPGTRGLG